MRAPLFLLSSLTCLLLACGEDIQEAVDDISTGDANDVDNVDDGDDAAAGEGAGEAGESASGADSDTTPASGGEDTAEPNREDETDGGDDGASPNQACQDFIYIDIDADQAQLSGEWDYGVSNIAPEEGDIVFPLGPGASGEASFSALLPCADEWRVWVRGLDNDQEDSFFVDIDDELSSAIFDLDCQGSFFPQPQYLWAPLNRRTDEFGCGLDNLLAIERDPGQLSLRFSEREQGAISAVVITNDPAFTPG